MSFPVKLINPLIVPEWDSLVAQFPGATVFHTASWARVLHHTYGYEPNYLLIGSSDQPKALLPLMGIRSWLTGNRGVSLPFTDECAPLCSNTQSFDELFAAARTLGDTHRWKTLEFRGGSTLFANTAGFQPSVSFWGHVLNFPSTEEGLLSGMAKSTRAAIRQAERKNLQVETSDATAAMREFYALLCLTRKRHGVPPQSWDFFANLHKDVISSGGGCVTVARHAGIPVAGAVFLHSGKTVVYKYGASDDTQQHLRASNLVIWSGIKWHFQREFNRIDFGRTSLSNEGLRRFKLSWGAGEARVDYVKLDLKSGGFVASLDRASGWHTRIFQRMPISMSRIVGRLLYPHLA
jgi:hypothetical protein